MDNCDEENILDQQSKSHQKSRYITPHSVVIKIQCFLSRIFRVNRRQVLSKVLIIFVFLILLSLLFAVAYIYCTGDMEVNGWERNKIRKAALYVHPDNDTALTHADASICSTKQPLVIIMVCSDTKNNSLRKAIRETWASDAEKFNMKVLFLVGISEDEDINMETLKESIQYKDIITENVIDTYNNLTIKSIFMLKWVKENCMQARFLMKVDDDTYVNIKNLFQFASVVGEEELETFLIGNVQKNANPERFHFSKWYMPMYMYPDKEYPRYIHGVAYLMSTNVAEKLYNQSLQNEFIHLEDVYITGICAQQINIRPKNNPLFHFCYDPVPVVQCGSARSRLVVLSHHTNVYYMYKFHDQLREC